jgi:hypothetical protein
MYVDKEVVLALGLLAAVILVLFLAVFFFPVDIGMGKAVALTTDKASYAADETIVVAVKNNLEKPVWFRAPSNNCWPKMNLLGRKNRAWESVPLLPMAPMAGECTTVTTKLEPGETITLEYQPSRWHDQIFFNFDSYKMGIGYSISEGVMETTPSYSNEFTISETLPRD